MKLQVAALPMMMMETGERHVVLMTSRETRRWVIPKGWPMKGLKNHEAAAREAYEEAGLVGAIAKKPIGKYDYFKRMSDSFARCAVEVYVMTVKSQLPDWPERGEREIRLMPLAEAAERVEETGLKAILARLAAEAAKARPRD